MTHNAQRIRQRRFTIEEYYKMSDAGILREDDRVELIEGEIVEMSPVGTPHSSSVVRLTRLLILAVGDKAVVSTQNPIRLGKRSQPEPDILILKPRGDDYAEAHPEPKDVLWLIEVSDTTLNYDRTTKLSLYARFNVPETWIVNLTDKRLEIYREPSPRGYKLARFLEGTDTASPERLPKFSVSVKSIFGQQ